MAHQAGALAEVPFDFDARGNRVRRADFARFATLYRAAGEISPPDAIPSRIEVEWDLGQGARLVRHPWSRAVWRRAGKGARLFVSGLPFALSSRDAKRLAAATEIDGPLYTSLSQAGRDAVFALMEAGHYQMLTDEDE